MMEFLGDALTTIVSGGVTGILGSAVQSYSNYKMTQLAGEQEQKRLEHDKEMVRLETEAQVTIAQQERAAQNDLYQQNLQMASYNHDRATYMSGNNAPAWILALLGLVDVMRGLVRPCLTTYMAVVVGVILYESNALLSNATMTSEETLAITSDIWQTIMYLATTIFFWWFGQRPPKKSV